MSYAECFKLRGPQRGLSDVTGLHWLPEATDWRARLGALSATAEPSWDGAAALANMRLDFVRTNALDATVRSRLATQPANFGTKPVRLALLGSATLAHLHAGIRVAGLRRGILIET